MNDCEFVRVDAHEWFCVTHQTINFRGTDEPNYCVDNDPTALAHEEHNERVRRGEFGGLADEDARTT